MQTQKQRSTYQELELIPTSPVQPPQSQRFLLALRNIWSNILLSLTASNEPQISQSIDAEGKQYWRIHIPRTRQSIICASEQEVYRWLEQHLCNQTLQAPNYFAPHHFPDRFRL